MERKTLYLPADGLASWIAALKETQPVYAPQPMGDDGPRIAAVDDASAVDLGLDCRRTSIRELWMPQTEVLFRYELDSDGATIEPVERDAAPKVVFGLRPCEAAAIRRVTHVMRQGEHPDPLGLEAQSMALVSLYCTDARRTCFCAQVGSPIEMVEEGSDIVMTPVEGGWVLYVITELGENAVAAAGDLADATDEQTSASESVQASLLDAMPSDGRIGALAETAKALWGHAAFREEAERCLGCAICTYLCPACHCFDVLDERRGAEGHRYRCWDSCQFGHFTLHASRHNPRPDQGARLRQRALHKFLYMPGEFDVVGCTGCGRCAELCPVGISIRRVVERVQREAAPA